MLAVFEEVKQKQIDLERLQIVAQANEITYRQKGEIHTAERFGQLADTLAEVIRLLKQHNS